MRVVGTLLKFQLSIVPITYSVQYTSTTPDNVKMHDVGESQLYRSYIFTVFWRIKSDYVPGKRHSFAKILVFVILILWKNVCQSWLYLGKNEKGENILDCQYRGDASCKAVRAKGKFDYTPFENRRKAYHTGQEWIKHLTAASEPRQASPRRQLKHLTDTFLRDSGTRWK